jgi:hypothetical protein
MVTGYENVVEIGNRNFQEMAQNDLHTKFTVDWD